MKITLLRFYVLILLLYSFNYAIAQGQPDPLLPLLKQELQYNQEELKKQDLPPYHICLRVLDEYNVSISSSFGVIASSIDYRTRVLVPQIRLGSPELDNFKYNSQGAAVGLPGQGSAMGAYLPLEDRFTESIREAIWQETLKRYQIARDHYENAKTKASVSVEDEDKAPCFSESPVENYYEAPLPQTQRSIDISSWEKRLNEVSAKFKSCPELQNGSASLNFATGRTYFIDSDGTEIVQNRVSARVMLSASIKAADGMELPLHLDYFAYSPEELPATEQMTADAQEMIRRLLALRNAPVADPFSGPAILSGGASGVFFHEIFGHRLEGHRLKSGGQTFKKMVGEQILPQEFQVYCDPTLRRYADTDMNGYYLYDDEGVKARRVDNVVNGVLHEFLMSRTPLDGFPHSNGHGRCTGGGDPVSRQSNLIIETTRPYTEAELRRMLVKEAQKQGKEYGYYINSVTSGFTFTGEGGSLNSFNVTPLEVYRVFVDGRPDELVRGVDMIGTPLSMFSNIAAAGDQPAVFTGSCGAESGWVPVTATSPMIYISQIETQRREQSRTLPLILPAPETTQAHTGTNDEVIFDALRDEMQRNREKLLLPGEGRPYYFSYALGRYRHFQVMASLGGVVHSLFSPWAMNGGTQVMLGDYNHNNDVQYVGQVAPTALPSETDYDGIRRGFWQSSDMMYRYALSSLAQKNNFLKSNPLSPEEAAVPDMQQLPAVTRIMERKREYIIDESALETLAAEVSVVFKEYPDIFNSSVMISGQEMDVYRLTSEEVALKLPQGYASFIVKAETRAVDGSRISDSFVLYTNTPTDLPSTEELKGKVKTFAEGLLRLREAPAMDAYYTGPVLFENSAVARIFINNLLSHGQLLAQRTLPPQPGMLEQQLNRKIIDSRLTIKNYSSVEEYNGTPLLGYYEIDGDGVVPEKEITLVERGLFKQMLNGRVPTLKAPHSTGSARFMNNPQSLVAVTSMGSIHVQTEKGLSLEKLKKSLLKAAKDQGLEHAYIVREVAGVASKVYRVNVKTGEETQVRVTTLKLPEVMKLTTLEGVSSKENVMSYLSNSCLTSLIYPAGIIVRDVEINKATPKVEKAPAILPPLQRE